MKVLHRKQHGDHHAWCGVEVLAKQSRKRQCSDQTGLPPALSVLSLISTASTTKFKLEISLVCHR